MCIIENGKIKLYHRTHKRHVDSILQKGILTGDKVQQGERLPFVMATKKPYHAGTGHLAAFEFEVDANDKRLIHVNSGWVEWHSDVPVENLTKIYWPPRDNAEVINILEHYDQEELDRRYEYHVLPRAVSLLDLRLV